MGLKVAGRIAKEVGQSLRLYASSRHFRLVSIDIILRFLLWLTLQRQVASFLYKLKWLPLIVHFLLGLDSMDKHRIQALTVMKVLQYVPLENYENKSWRADRYHRDGQVSWRFEAVPDTHVDFYARYRNFTASCVIPAPMSFMCF